MEQIALLMAEPAPRNMGTLSSKCMEKRRDNCIASLGRFHLEHLADTNFPLCLVLGG